MKPKSSTRKTKTRRASRKTHPGGRSPRYTTLTAQQKVEYERAIKLLANLRDGKGSYTKLLRQHRLSTQKAHRYLGSNLLGGTRGKRVRASKTDRLVRELFFPTPVGDVRQPVRGLPAATKLSNYYHDRDELLGNNMSAEEFEAKWDGERVDGRELFADADQIFRMEDAGVLKLENLYASVESPE
jgi:hypothetical protein